MNMLAGSGILGPYFMAILVGSGDAATMAFNEAVTPHAATFGMSVIPVFSSTIFAKNPRKPDGTSHRV